VLNGGRKLAATAEFSPSPPSEGGEGRGEEGRLAYDWIGKTVPLPQSEAMARNVKSVVVRVPASTSNLGSGFDTLGLAVKLYNRIRLTGNSSTGARIVSPIAEGERPSATGMIEKAAAEFFQLSRTTPFGFKVSLRGDVPVARGLGYSATARLGVVAGLNVLTSAGLNRQQLLELVTSLEGHPDNASPAVLGGCTVSGIVDGKVRCLRFPVSPKVKLVTLIPHFQVSTEKARSLLPQHYSRADAAHAINRAALITGAFAGQNYEALRGLFEDRIHQPYREPLIPELGRVIRAGEAAGAIGGFLSGSGSAIICLTLEKPRKVAEAMKKELPDSQVIVLTADDEGFRIIGK